jgi:hypothetical protein
MSRGYVIVWLTALHRNKLTYHNYPHSYDSCHYREVRFGT